eukprot:TRINITY_DN8995_c0_g1_i1.p1 TRINITY_DN8995_c0_g1~~TRINITY_DN8995_c0_g1_i1.p1  ORF type:complete len:573 (+),score=223.95 TRINITY_DN8995_c0_g1_i1:45-1721(+)
MLAAIVLIIAVSAVHAQNGSVAGSVSCQHEGADCRAINGDEAVAGECKLLDTSSPTNVPELYCHYNNMPCRPGSFEPSDDVQCETPQAPNGGVCVKVECDAAAGGDVKRQSEFKCVQFECRPQSTGTQDPCANRESGSPCTTPNGEQKTCTPNGCVGEPPCDSSTPGTNCPCPPGTQRNAAGACVNVCATCDDCGCVLHSADGNEQSGRCSDGKCVEAATCASGQPCETGDGAGLFTPNCDCKLCSDLKGSDCLLSTSASGQSQHGSFDANCKCVAFTEPVCDGNVAVAHRLGERNALAVGVERAVLRLAARRRRQQAVAALEVRAQLAVAVGRKETGAVARLARLAARARRRLDALAVAAAAALLVAVGRVQHAPAVVARRAHVDTRAGGVALRAGRARAVGARRRRIAGRLANAAVRRARLLLAVGRGARRTAFAVRARVLGAGRLRAALKLHALELALALHVAAGGRVALYLDADATVGRLRSLALHVVAGLETSRTTRHVIVMAVEFGNIGRRRRIKQLALAGDGFVAIDGATVSTFMLTRNTASNTAILRMNS